MQQITVVLDERLANPGSSLPFKGHLNEESYTLGDRSFTLPKGIDYDLVLTNAGEGILATGMLRAHVTGVCDRCLDEAAFDVAAEVNEYFLFEPPAQESLDDDEDEADFSLVSGDSTIDLTEPLTAALLMETPFVVLCKPDCKGLCPICGANLNHEDCGHAAQIEKDRLASSPFGVLADLKLESEEDSREEGDGGTDVKNRE